MKKTHTRITALLGALAMAAWGIGMTGCFTSINDSDDNSGGGGGKYELLVDGGPSGRIKPTAPSGGSIEYAEGVSTRAISRAIVPLAASGPQTLAEALDKAEKASGPVVITLAPGTYDATGLKYKGKNDLTIRGSSSIDYGTDVLIVGMGSDMSQESTRSLLSFEGSANIVLENLTLKNSYGETTGTAQAETLGVSNNVFTGTLAVYNCSFLSGQDTICTQGKAWFYHCYIEGDVDFIWMEGTKPGARVALYEECIIRAIGTRSSSAYIAAPRLAKEASVWKGVVFYNSILQAETGLKNFYLGRNPWDGSSDYYENVAIVACRLQLASGVTLHSDIWKSNAYGTSNQQHIGFKTDEYFTKSAAGHGARLTSAHIAADYAGRENILNRYYDFNAAKFKQDAEAYWDINALIAARGWNVTLDTSSSLATGETKVKSVTYNLLDEAIAKHGGDPGKGQKFTDGSTDDGVLSWKTLYSNEKSSGWTYGNGGTTITIKVTEQSVITLTTYDGTKGISVKDGSGNTLVSDGTTSNEKSLAFLYSGSGTTLTITSSGQTYISTINIKTLTDETDKVTSVSIGGAANVTTNGTGTLTASCATTYLNDYTPKNYSWSCTSGATVSGNGASATITGGSSDATVTVTCTVDGVSGKKTVTVGEVNPVVGQTYSYTTLGTDVKGTGTWVSPDTFLTIVSTGENSHGPIVKSSTFSIKVAGSVKITIGLCYYNTDGTTVTVTDSSNSSVGSVTLGKAADSNCTSTVDFSYTGAATTLTFAVPAATTYLRSIVVTPAN